MGDGGGTDQQHREPAEAGTGEGYVRLRMRLRGDVLQVVDSHFVEGPLAQHSTFHGSHAYEVSLGDQLLHAGSLPDLGVTSARSSRLTARRAGWVTTWSSARWSSSWRGCRPRRSRCRRWPASG